MGKKRIMSFFEYMQAYPHRDPSRIALAASLATAAKYHTDEIVSIDSLIEMMTVSMKYAGNGKALLAINPSLWCEYCAVVGRPFLEENISNEPERKLRKRNTE